MLIGNQTSLNISVSVPNQLYYKGGKILLLQTVAGVSFVPKCLFLSLVYCFRHKCTAKQLDTIEFFTVLKKKKEKNPN